MKAIESIIAVILTVILLVVLPSFVKAERDGNRMERQAGEYAGKLLADVQEEGFLTAGQYYALAAFLSACGYGGNFEITGYYYEYGIDGKEYQHSISAEEIMDGLAGGEYRFKDGTYVCVRVPAVSPGSLVTDVLYGRKPIEKSVRVGK